MGLWHVVRQKALLDNNAFTVNDQSPVQWRKEIIWLAKDYKRLPNR